MKYISILTYIALVLPLLVQCTDEKKVYIVYLGEHSGYKTHNEIEEYHHSYLFSLKGSEEEARNSLIYSYKNSINGFAAELTKTEAQKLSEFDEVVSIYPSKSRKLHTTRSWEFLGVRKGEKRNVPSKNKLLKQAKYGKHVIVGLLDTGIWPEAESFNDKGMGPIPKSWKGICQEGEAFNSSHCNKKLIGARYYFKGYQKAHKGQKPNPTISYLSARDKEGHGTHTSSIVGGQLVHAKVAGGFAHGTASGGAPLVHLAMYKVCWGDEGCFDEDTLAGIDDAIGDGVHVLSMSIGGSGYMDYASDAMAMGSLHAVRNNIVVTCSAGNSGPKVSSLENTAPWIMTVAASSIDRAFVAPLLLGNGMKITGESFSVYKLEEKMYPLVYAGDVEEPSVPKTNSGLCFYGSLSPKKTKGKIVLCLRGLVDAVSQGDEVGRAGGSGLIVANTQEQGEQISADPFLLPASEVGFINGEKILQYINSTKNPMAYIYSGRTALNVKPAPKMAIFSSRGPDVVTPDILKPDITAPGENILAAWSEGAEDSAKFNIISGTSMSCPHVGAVAALIKAIHPTWSSAAIRSAIMTTAVPTNNMNMPITDSEGTKADPFHYGSGHIHPTKAAYPGLVYDASYFDYLIFLCSSDIKAVPKSFKCPKNPPLPNSLNYPSLAISKINGTVTVKRVVTNVGHSDSTYISKVEAPRGFSVKLSPHTLEFSHVGEKKWFTITVKADKSKTKRNMDGDTQVPNYVFGSYSWSDGVHVVRSPIAINLA